MKSGTRLSQAPNSKRRPVRPQANASDESEQRLRSFPSSAEAPLLARTTSRQARRVTAADRPVSLECETGAVGAIEDRLDGLGLRLPAPVVAPPGVQVPFEFVRVHGGLAYASGHGPFDGDRLLVTGRVGAEVSVEQASDAARATAL
jgi:hypothetical protein